MQLTQEYLKTILHYDPIVGEFTQIARTSRRVKIGDKAGTICNGYLHISVKNIVYKAHRLAWLYIYGEWPKDQIDHINGVRDDNRLVNLRDVSPRVNSQNKRMDAKNVSGANGVCFNKARHKWRANIKVNRKNIYLGYFEDWFDAVCARKSADNLYGFHINHGRKT